MKLPNDLVVLDLETTGIWIEKDKIVEIAMIRITPSGEKTTYCKRVNPGIPIPTRVSELIGITNEQIAKEPPFRNFAQEILEFLEGADLAGFNVERFDLPLLEREMFEAGHKFEWQKRTIFDAQKIYHMKEKRDLTAAYKFYCKKDLVNAHSALADTEATLEILTAQVQQYGEDDALLPFGQMNYRNLSEFYDEGRKFRWWNGELYPMFGKYAKRASLQEMAKKDPNYLDWILRSDFSEDVKTLVQEALKGQFPEFKEVKVEEGAQLPE